MNPDLAVTMSLDEPLPILLSRRSLGAKPTDRALRQILANTFVDSYGRKYVRMPDGSMRRVR
jgi:hypothetical protein